MSLLQHCTRWSRPSLWSTFSRCRRLSSGPAGNTPTLRDRFPSRSILIKDFPPTSTIVDFLALKGTGHRVESVIKHPGNNSVEIHYLEPYGAQYVRGMSTRGQLIVDGKPCDAEFLPPQRLPVELVAAIGLRGASRKVVMRSLGNRFTKQELEEELTRRFGEVEDLWMKENGENATVTFSSLSTAVKALKTLLKEGWKLFFRDDMKRIKKNKDMVDARHTVFLQGLPRRLTPQHVLRDLNDVLRFRNGDPMIVYTTGQGAFLTFNNSYNAASFYKIYRPPTGISAHMASKRPPLDMERSAINLGARRTLIIDGFKDPAITFDRLHQDFDKFGPVFYVYLNPEKAHARVVFTNIASSLKAIEYIHENRAEYDIYHGARITFGQQKAEELSPLRPIFIRSTVSANIISHSPEDTGAPLREVADEIISADDGYDDWQIIDSSPDLGEVDWTERWDGVIGRDRLDVSPRKQQ